MEDYVWEEQQSAIPDYPEDADLLEFKVNIPNSPFRFYIDTRSLTISDQDSVIRYTLVLRAKNGGSNNVSYEGLRCTTREYKVYAYGDVRGKFRPMPKPQWRPVRDTGPTSYRKDLWEYYLCPLNLVNPTPEKLIHNIRYFNVDRKKWGFH